MHLVVGLGNPEKEYENTRHNAGFMALDALAKQQNFPDFQLSKKQYSLISEGILSSATLVLAKPQTFMNHSGVAVKKLIENCLHTRDIPKGQKLKIENLVVVHDDIDIPLGKIRVSKNSGSAGHKGVQSIIQALGTKNFTRIRIGIQPATGKPTNVEHFVLENFTPKETLLVRSAMSKTLEALEKLLSS